MKYSITFREEDYEVLIDHLLSDRSVERAAYVLCRPSVSESETRLIVREILPVAGEEILEASKVHMRIASRSFMRAMKRAHLAKSVFVFVHSHPDGVASHSEQDDKEEKELFRTAFNRISTPGVHGSMVFSSAEDVRARVWLENGTGSPVDRVRVVGRRFRFLDQGREIDPLPVFFDRQIRAFGPEIQVLLRALHVGIVGLGGTGSAVGEQLIRIGVGSLLVADGQSFEKSNINRVYGSRVVDDSIAKTKIFERLAADIGLGTNIRTLPRHITAESVVKELRDCDIVFGCTDDEWGRSILSRLAVYYVLPVIDMGVKVDSNDGVIKAVEGRVTTLLPGMACLFCRQRVNSDTIRAESLAATNPEQAQQLMDEGYVPRLETRAPAIIPFATSIAALAVSELLHRLTGYLGSERTTTEVIYQFHETKLRANSTASKAECFCNDPFYIGRADVSPFLDLTWPVNAS